MVNKRDTEIISSDSDPNMKKRSNKELPSWLQPTEKPITSEDRHGIANTSRKKELPDSLQPTPKPSGTVHLEKSKNDTNDSDTTNSRRNVQFIKKERLRTPPKQTQPVEDKNEEDEEMFYEELDTPKRSSRWKTEPMHVIRS